MRTVFGGLAVIDLASLVVVHLLSFVPGVVLPKPLLFPLGLGTILTFGMALLVTADLTERLRRRTRTPPQEAHRVLNGLLMGEFALVGRKAVLGVAFGYAVLNFGSGILFSEGGGTAAEENGRYVLKSHGQLIRELSGDEFEFHQRLPVRVMTGHMLPFALIAAIYFLKVYPVARRAIPPRQPRAVPVRPADDIGS